FTNPDFETLAQAFGMWGRTLTAADQLKPALEEAFAQPGPALIALPIDYGENMKLTKRLGELAFTI
ncbi:MAG: thiamine pyrophosphate-dependent enzyme, partial [Alphaproteobacteria bacterium]